MRLRAFQLSTGLNYVIVLGRFIVNYVKPACGSRESGGYLARLEATSENANAIPYESWNYWFD